MKKTIIFMLTAMVLSLAAIMVLSLAACNSSGDAQKSSAATSVPHSESSSLQIPNPYIDCESLEDAARLAEFDILVPDSIDHYSERAIRAIKRQMIEVIYNDGEKEIRIRKAVGTEDISGDFNQYAENNQVDSDGLQITMRGSDHKINVATWIANSYTFALSMSDGRTTDEVLALVAEVQ